ncbi:mor transcription activator family protein [Rodentibacter trehalosifermentans]|uniref:Mor transcription activator family protein n=2 Tax=Rodentibacter trehalosifermentans TaxID=1908263 RepID=A0A1V3J0E4_9PAST|nr:mor transcription activator family protein [Rodentibacter trehalosifermentans]
MQEIAEIIGMENLELFLKNFGGVCFRFSNGKVYFPELENALGAELAEKLQRHFSGEDIYIPLCHIALKVLRNYQIKAEFDYYTQEEGLSGRKTVRLLSPKYQLSDRTIWQIMRDLR